MKIYGVLDGNGCHIDISKSEKAAKKHATQHGYDIVSVRYDGSLYVDVVAIKSKLTGRWVSIIEAQGKVKCFRKS